MVSSSSVADAHKFTSMHRSAIEASIECVCGYCRARFPPAEIEEWTDWLLSLPDDQWTSANGQTAICPYCSVDAVLPGSVGLDLSQEFLEKFHDHWF